MEWAGLPSRETEGFLGKTFLLRSVLPPCPASGARSDWGRGDRRKQTHRPADELGSGVLCSLTEKMEHPRSLAF